MKMATFRPLNEVIIPVTFLLLLIFVIQPTFGRQVIFNLLTIGALGSLFLSEFTLEKGMLKIMQRDVTVPRFMQMISIAMILGVVTLLLANLAGAANLSGSFFGSFFVDVNIELSSIIGVFFAVIVQPLTETIIFVFFAVWAESRFGYFGIPRWLTILLTVILVALFVSVFHAASIPMYKFPSDMAAYLVSSYSLPYIMMGIIWTAVWFYKRSFLLCWLVHTTLNTVSALIETFGQPEVVVPAFVGIAFVIIMAFSYQFFSWEFVKKVEALA